ncbi:major facilitator superfamily domain-containing protein [Boletus reticuloceps]|uniref:Major facilitator superfamily domain-containing protein n=1 Tax=Boletus reticuloceps TaxID=495285 RepID=A0A8I2YY99_9AGAM|nr:major facilitator superfamily domain-containing protein [Boletus reticuloceps]
MSSPESLSDKQHITITHSNDGAKQAQSSAAVFNPDVDVSGIDERKLMRKVDSRTIPWLAFLYLLAFLDRTSIGNAKLYGLETDLHLTDTQYLLCLTLFFFSYAIFEVPSNIVLKRLRPSVWLSLLMLLWGISMPYGCVVVATSTLGFDDLDLIALRWLLGMFEAGLFPGVTYYLSCWYKRSEFGVRIAIFFSAATVSGAFGGLLAAGISRLEGVGGRPAWSWIFIIEGLATVVAGALSFWIIVDFPEDAAFLTEAERTVVIRRLQGDDQFSAAGERLKWKNIVASLTDWKTYLYSTSRLEFCDRVAERTLAIVYSGADMALYAFALFLPSIISQVYSRICYKATPANLLTVPVYVLACIVTCSVGFLADRYGNRGWFNLRDHIIHPAAAGYIILISSRNATLSYIAVYLAACAWAANNLEGTYKRSVSLGVIISVGNLQGAISSNVYRANQTPWYPLGHGLVLMYICFGLISTVAMIFMLKAENGRRERGERDEVIDKYDGGLEVNGRFGSVEDAQREKGDRWSGYRYML